MEKNKKLGLIIVSIVGLLFGIALVLYGFFDLKKSNENTVDENPYGDDIRTAGETIYLYEEGSNTEYVGKYTCENKYCDFNLPSQFLGIYSNSNAGVGLLFDTNEDTTGYFLYDFKNATKISDEYNFTNIIYSKDDVDYFRIEDMKSKKVGVISSKGEIIIPVSYDDIGINMLQTDVSSTSAFAKYTGVSLVSLNNKYGLIDLETGKEILKAEYDKIGDLNIAPSAFANNKLEEIYVIKDNKGSLINYKTGEVVKEFETKYDYVYPINENIIVTVLNNEIDILENDKSILEEKIKFEEKTDMPSYYLHHELLPNDAEKESYDMFFGDSNSKSFYIEVDYNNEGNSFNKIYKFDITSKKLVEDTSSSN